MFDNYSPNLRRTGPSASESGWAEAPEPTRQSTGRRGTPVPPVITAKKAEPPTRLSSPINVGELRAIAGSKVHSAKARHGLTVLSIWLGRQPKETIAASRRVASNLGTEVIRGEKTVEQIIETLFPNVSSIFLLRKAKAMTSILERRSLDEGVVDLAVSHISSQCACTEDSVKMAEEYAERLCAQKPSLYVFSQDTNLWWPFLPATE